MSRAQKADPFDVWGKPPAPLDKLPKKHLATLRRYVEHVAHQAYRIGYDNGLIEGLTKISMVSAVEIKRQRERMLRTK